jgi:glutamate-1-semialdehyde 2,1-aminomutase
MARTSTRRDELVARAAKVLAGGVSSDARRLPGGPLFVDHADGARIVDVDGNSYVDFVMGQGPAILGHGSPVVVDAVTAQAHRGMSYSAQHEDEVELAELVCELVPCAQRVRFNSVGSEAVHGALRLARGYTGRGKILKFEGHYHGWFDPVLYSVHPPLELAGPAEAPNVVASTAGQQTSSAGDLVLAPWNDLPALRAILAEHGSDIAAVIMEPILCNTGVIPPVPGFLDGVRALCDDIGALLVFDEIITGFRVAPGGAQEKLGMTPDLAVFGKAMAGGMQLSALTGRAEVMDEISTGRVAHAGTFNSHPVSVAAALATMRALDERRDTLYPRLYRLGTRLADGLRAAAAKAGVPLLVSDFGPLVQMYLTDAADVRGYRDYAATDLKAMARLHGLLLERGVNVVPRGLWFLSAAHTGTDVDEAVDKAEEAFAEL